MKYSDHYILGKYAADIFGIKQPLHRACFIWGNIYPDLNKFTYMQGYSRLLDKLSSMGVPLTLNGRRKLLIAGHTAEGSRHYINKQSRYLINKDNWSFADWYRFGKAVHYVADRFTYPHTLKYTDGFFKHVEYEEELHDRFADIVRRIRVFDMDVKDAGNSKKRILKNFDRFSFDTLYKAYRGEKATVENDSMYIISCCVKYMEYILGNCDKKLFLTGLPG